MARPFEGIRIIDITHVLAGPFATYQLALMGADVIKVEDPNAPDQSRDSGTREQEFLRAIHALPYAVGHDYLNPSLKAGPCHSSDAHQRRFHVVLANIENPFCVNPRFTTEL